MNTPINKLSLGRLSLVAILIGILCVSGCVSGEDQDPPVNGQNPPISEDPPAPEYYVKFKANGVEKMWEASTPVSMSIAVFSYNGELGHYASGIQGVKKGTDGTRDIIHITLWNESLFAADISYQLQDTIKVHGLNLPRIMFQYHDENGKPHLTGTLEEDIAFSGSRAEVKFSEITPTYVKGTFSAKTFSLEEEDLVPSKEMLITEGEFFLPSSNHPNYK